ncbi:MAG: hypothetical protein HY314_10775 [Acidobacteria bacterium]|nr:hypothetical protein [Acidobacteriota bacterium]
MRSVQHRTDLVFRYAVVVVGLLLVMPAIIRAERLPIKVYTTADGLAQNAVNRIVRDSRGFLWFCTEDGLSRYDGYTFTNYGIEQGLPNRRVTDLLETRQGQYWVATGGGLCRFNPAQGTGDRGRETGPQRLVPGLRSSTQPSMFTVFYPGEDERTRFVTKLLEDRAGTIWCGTQRGLFRLEQTGDHTKLTPVDIGMPLQLPEGGGINALCEDRYGTLWIGAASGLYRRWPDGRTTRYSKRDGLPGEGVFTSLLEDRQGHLWAGTPFYGLD